MYRFLTLALAVLPALAYAQYPNKPVRLIVPYIAGSAPDTSARVVAQRLSEGMGQPFVVDNRPGASANIGMTQLAKSAPDGYTIGLGTANSHAVNKFLFKSQGFDPLADFAPISLIAAVPSVLVVSASLPVKDVKQLVALAKSKPGALNYASGGNGSLAHLSAEAFRVLTGVETVHVPFKGAPEIITALLSNTVAYGFPTSPTAYPLVKAGKLRALAITGEARSSLLPDVPTMLEAYPPGFVLDSWFGLFAPASTAREIVVRLHEAVVRMMREPAFIARLTADGTEARYSDSPEAFAAYVKAEGEKWQKVVAASGARID